jgi:hypothetical protein
VVFKCCVWHRRSFGYPVVFDIASWRGKGLHFVDSICGRCTARIRRDLAGGTRAWGARDRASWEAPMALPPMMVMILAAIVIILAARPLDFVPPVEEPREERQVAAPAAETSPAPQAPSGEPVVPTRHVDTVRAVQQQQELVPPPERVVYVPGWRTSGVSPRAPVKPVSSTRRGTRADDGLPSRSVTILQAQ